MKRACGCPTHCKYDGARLRRDAVGHYCPTRNCQWEFGVPDCMQGRAERSDAPKEPPAATVSRVTGGGDG